MDWLHPRKDGAQVHAHGSELRKLRRTTFAWRASRSSRSIWARVSEGWRGVWDEFRNWLLTAWALT
jgi:hypothetical protein